MAHTRQSRLDSGIGVLVKVLKIISIVPSALTLDHKSKSLKYEPSSELLLITAKQLFLDRVLRGTLDLADVAAVPFRWRVDMAHIKQSRPDSGIALQVKVLKLF